MKGREMGDGIPSEEKREMEGGYIVPRKEDIVSRSSTAKTATRAHIRHPVGNKTSRPTLLPPCCRNGTYGRTLARFP
jgi:hypothetical protein